MSPTRILLAFCIAWPCLASPGLARAIPTDLTVDPATTSLVFGVSSSVGSDTVPLDLAGVLSSDLTVTNDPIFGPIVTNAEILGGVLDVAHPPLSILGPGVSLAFSSEDLTASVGGPPVDAFGVAPGFSIGDFRDYTITLDGGTFSVVGELLATPFDVSLDLAVTPVTLTLPLNSVGQIQTAAASGGGLDVFVSVPVSATTQIFVDGLTVDLELSGQVGLQGFVVPEPTTGLLVALGLGLLAAARKNTAR